MVARRAFTLVRAAAAASLLLASISTPTLGAECALAGPASAEVGTSVSIQGSGFTPATSIEVEITTDGAATDGLLLTASGIGSFQVAFTPESSEAGRMRVTASDGACTAELVFDVILAGEEAPTEPVPAAPAGGAAAGEAAPPTDARPVPTGTGPTVAAPWTVAAALFVIGVAGRLATRRATPR